MAECLHRADAQRPFEESEKQKSAICVSVTPRYGVLKVWALLLHETPHDRVQPEGFTQAVLLSGWWYQPASASALLTQTGPFSLKDSHHYTTGSERPSSSQPLLLLSNVGHKHLTGHFFGSETVMFSLFTKHQVSSH